MLNAAVVGLGWWGKQIVTCLADSDRIDVVRGVDVNLETARDFAAAHGLELGDSYDDVLADPAVDAVILVTPHLLHEEQVLAATAAGKQIFCEKPFALDADAARRMLAACDEKNIVVGIGHERRFEPALEALKRHLDDGGELAVLLVLEADIAWVDAVLVERLGAGRMIGKQFVADVMEVADERHLHAHLAELVPDVRDGSRRLVAVYRDAHQLGAGAGECGHLARCALGIGGVGVGHRLHDDGRSAAHGDAGDVDGHRLMAILPVHRHQLSLARPKCQRPLQASTPAACGLTARQGVAKEHGDIA